MSYFKINEPGKAVKFIKNIDRATHTLEFSSTSSGCYQRESGFYAKSELQYLKFHFKEKYPEIEYCELHSPSGW